MKNLSIIPICYILAFLFVQTVFLNAQDKPVEFEDEVVEEVVEYEDRKSSAKSEVLEIFSQKGKMGVRKKNSKEVILEATFDNIREVDKRSKVFAPGVSKYNKVYIVKKNGKSGVVDKQGNFFLELEYDVITSNYVAKDGKYGIINLVKTEVVPLKYDKIEYLSIGHLSFLEDQKWGVMTTNGRKIIAPKYSKITQDFFEDYLLLHDENDKIGLFNKMNRRIVFKPQFDELVKIEKRIKPKKVTAANFYDEKNPYFKAKKNSKLGIVDMGGNIIIQLLYSELEEVLDPESLVGFIYKNDKNVGLIDSEGMIIYPDNYKEIKYLNQNMFSLKKKKRYALANSNGEILTPFKYDRIGYFVEITQIPDEWKSTKIELKGKYGIINWKGEVLEKVNKKIELNGFEDVEVLFNEFVIALKSDDNKIIQEFCNRISVDSQTVDMMLRLDLDYRGIPQKLLAEKKLVDVLSADYYSRMIAYKERLKKNEELSSLINIGPERLGYGVFNERYDIPATEIYFIMKSDKMEHRVKLGELIKINGVWKSFTYPRFN